MTLVEKMARAISRSIYGSDEYWENWDDSARMVLAAMREPPFTAYADAEAMADRYWPSCARPEEIWQAMIDQAIKEGE